MLFISKGIPEKDIIPEERSTTTLENLRFSQEILDSAAFKDTEAYLQALSASDDMSGLLLAYINADGSVSKKVNFRFVRFRRYT